VDAKQLLRAQYLQWLALGLSKQDWRPKDQM
jgi:hypothetical protein